MRKLIFICFIVLPMIAFGQSKNVQIKRAEVIKMFNDVQSQNGRVLVQDGNNLKLTYTTGEIQIENAKLSDKNYTDKLRFEIVEIMYRVLYNYYFDDLTKYTFTDLYYEDVIFEISMIQKSGDIVYKRNKMPMTKALMGINDLQHFNSVIQEMN